MRTEYCQTPVTSVELVFYVDCLSTFSALLQQGVMVPLNSEVILRDFLYHHLGLSPEFVEGYLSTIFLNGKPVDDLDQATLRGGDTLALSAAMPGLVGATMRRQGVVASFRSGISHRQEEGAQSESGNATLVLKLFNLMIEAVGSTILENGVLLSKENWERFLKSSGVNLWDHCRTIRINGQEVHSLAEPFPWEGNVSLINLKISCNPIT